MTIRITWSDPNGPLTQEDEVRIYRDTAPFDAESLPAVLATLTADVETYDDTTAVANTSYWYAVSFVKDGREVVTLTSLVFVEGTLFSASDGFGAGSVTLTGQLITGSLFSAADAFGSGAVIQPTTIEGTLFSAPDVFGSGKIITSTEFTVTIATGTVASDLTNFVFPIHLADLPDSFWASARSDGGNVRVYAADGVTMIPHDMAFIDSTLKVGLLFARHTVLAASNTVVKVKLLTPDQTKLSASDTNGRNAVWADYQVAVVFPEVINRVDGSSPSVAGSPVEAKWKENKYLPVSMDRGCAFDGSVYYTVSSASIRRYSSSGTLLTTNSTLLTVMKAATGNSTLDSCGAPAIVDGELWVPVEKYPSGPYVAQYIGRFALSDLSFLGYIQLTGATRESSGVHYDTALGRLYVTDYTVSGNIPYFDKTTGAYVGQLTLSSSISQMRSIAELGGKYYIGTKAGAVYEVEKNGTVNGVVFQKTYGSDLVGVFAYDSELILAQALGYISHYAKSPGLQGWSRLNGVVTGYEKSKSTVFTMAVSWYGTPDIVGQSVIGIRSVGTPNDRHMIYYNPPGTNGFSIWNPTNGYLYTSPRSPASAYTKYRAAFGQNGTSARKLSVNGVKGSAGSSAAIPAASGNVRYEIAGGDNAKGYGYYQFAWVRHEYMSDAWIDADYLSFANPSAFYTIT